jgi:adenine C2-methylase RlmN of 23S rRNA A2503 and tRNA A37
MAFQPFRAKQIWHWICIAKRATDFTQMTTIARDQQTLLAVHFSVQRPAIAKALTSLTAHAKWSANFPTATRLRAFDPEEDRGTLCVSSQVGCNRVSAPSAIPERCRWCAI